MLKHRFNFNAGMPRPRGTIIQAFAVAGLLATHGATARAAEARATLRLKGVILKTVDVSLDPLPETDGRHFAGPQNAVRIMEQTNYASPYQMYLESGRTEAPKNLVFDGGPVVFRDGRALLEPRGLGRDSQVTKRFRVLGLARDAGNASSGPMLLVVRMP